MLTGVWNPQVHEQLVRLLDGPPGLAAFDFDNTLIFNDLGEAVMNYLVLQALLAGDREEFWQGLSEEPVRPDIDRLRGWWNSYRDTEDESDYLRFADALLSTYDRTYHEVGLEAAYRWSRFIFAWQNAEELKKISRHVLDDELLQTPREEKLPSGYVVNRGIRIYAEVKQLMHTLRGRGWELRVVTASPREVIQAVIGDWGLQPEQVLGMQLSRDSNGMLLPEILEPMPFQAGKVELLAAACDGRRPDLAIGDSSGDRDLLASAGLGILFDRGYRELWAALEKQGVLLQERPNISG
ncbi:MAG: haloacid dehalogenase-like hydrolase [Leptospiraceae bacterium]|nr:haloacid dehalogenase-like hydrolase [Leptospiraceae bacterium]